MERGLLMLAHGIDVESALLEGYAFGTYCAKHDYLSLLGWSLGKKYRLFHRRILTTAASFGSLKILQALSHSANVIVYYMHLAAENGHQHVIEWALEEGPLNTGKLCQSAAKGGQLRLLQWLRSKGYARDEETCEEAAIGGHLSTLQWACANGCPMNYRMCVGLAAQYGHNHIVEWLQCKRQRIEH